MQLVDRIHKILKSETQEQVHIAPLIVFRILFGLVTFISTIRFIALGWIEDQYLSSSMNFTYFGFSWITVPEASVLYALFAIMALASIGVIIGLFYRISIITFFLTFTYIELLDVSYYLNHYYFVSITAFLLIFVPANRFFAIDITRNKALKLTHVPRIFIDIFKLQIAIVYVYAGLAKINSDWLLQALPLKIWLPAKDGIPIIGFIFKYEITPYLFSWAGMIYDIFIPFLLLWNRTRTLAYFAVIGFHTMTGMLFQIGVFPIVMTALTLVFFSEKFHKNILIRIENVFESLRIPTKNKKNSPKKLFESNISKVSYGNVPTVLTAFFIVYSLVQLLVPLRHNLYPGNTFWTEEGYRFSWKVMLVEKAGTATFYVKDSKTRREGVVDNSEFLNRHQEKQMAFQPDMILQYAHFLKDHYLEKGITNPEVRAEVYVTMNGKPSQLYIDPSMNLVELSDGFSHRDWILPQENTKEITEKNSNTNLDLIP